MNSYEKSSVHSWLGKSFFFKEYINTLKSWIPSNVIQVVSPYNHMLACPHSPCLWVFATKHMHTFIHGECLFCGREPLSHIQIKKLDSDVERGCGSFLSAWKGEGKEAFSWSESTLNLGHFGPSWCREIVRNPDVNEYWVKYIQLCVCWTCFVLDVQRSEPFEKTEDGFTMKSVKEKIWNLFQLC